MSEVNADQSLISSLNSSLPALSPAMRRIARYALDNPYDFIRCTSKELCAQVETSEPTLIRFCKTFGKSGLSEFRIELAVSLSLEIATHQKTTGDSCFTDRQHGREHIPDLARKQKIAKAAIKLISDDSAILLDNSSTAQIFASHLGDVPNMTIMTVGLPVAHLAQSHSKHNVILTGGTLQPASLNMTGRLVGQAVKGMRFDTFIMGADSICNSHGISTFLEEDAENSKALMTAAKRVVVLVDATKFGNPCLHPVCDLDAVDVIVTDLPKKHDFIATLPSGKVSLLIV